MHACEQSEGMLTSSASATPAAKNVLNPKNCPPTIEKPTLWECRIPAALFRTGAVFSGGSSWEGINPNTYQRALPGKLFCSVTVTLN